jgi:hypothetical protein
MFVACYLCKLLHLRAKIAHIVATQKGTPDPDAPHVIEEITYECIVDRTKLKSDEQKGLLNMKVNLQPSAEVVRAIVADAVPVATSGHAFSAEAILEATRSSGWFGQFCLLCVRFFFCSLVKKSLA